MQEKVKQCSLSKAAYISLNSQGESRQWVQLDISPISNSLEKSEAATIFLPIDIRTLSTAAHLPVLHVQETNNPSSLEHGEV